MLFLVLLLSFSVVSDVANLVGLKDWTLLETDSAQRDVDCQESLSDPFYPGSRSNGVFSWIPGTTDILLFGGRSQGGLLSDTWLFHTSTSSTGLWEPLSPSSSPAAREEMGFTPVGSDGLVAIFGGEWGSSPSNDVWLYDNGQPSSSCWDEVSVVDATGAPTGAKGAAVWPVKTNASSTTWEGIIIGGGDTESVLVGFNPMFVFDGSSWSSHSTSGDIPTASVSPMTWVNFVDVKNELWMFGGRMESEFSATLSKLTPFDWSWTAVMSGSADEDAEYSGTAAHPGGRNTAAFASVCNVAVIHGGQGRFGEETGRLGGLWKLDTRLAGPAWEGWTFLKIEETDESSVDTTSPVWTGGLRTPAQRGGHMGTIVGNRFYLFGGSRNDGVGADLWEMTDLEFECAASDVIMVAATVVGLLLVLL